MNRPQFKYLSIMIYSLGLIIHFAGWSVSTALAEVVTHDRSTVSPAGSIINDRSTASPAGSITNDRSTASPAGSITKKVKEIRYIGLANITPRDLENLLPFNPGDLWNSSFSEATKQAVKTYYEKRGFYNAQIQVYPSSEETKDITLVVKVEEGPPCLIKSIWIDDPPGFNSKHVMLRFKSDMTNVVHTNVGERYDEQILGDKLRDLREWLIAKNYILANTDKVRLNYNENRTEVEVVLAVDYGDRVTFGFQGNTVFTKGELNEFITQVRTTGLGKDYIGVIQRKFVDEYKSRAYNSIKIDVRIGETAASKHITFFFREAMRSELVEIKWEGLSESNLQLAKDSFEKGAGRLLQRGYFVEKDFDKGILVVLEDLKAQGYLTSKLIAKTVQTVKQNEKDHRVRVSVQIAEGEQTLVGRVQVDGFSYFPIEKILGTLGVVEGTPFNPFALEEGLLKLRSLYISEAFLDFKVLTHEDDIVSFSETNRLANIKVKIHEGYRIKIGSIEVRGLQKTREYVVKREILAHTDDWWLGNTMQETENNLRNLGLFSEVKLISTGSTKGAGYRDLVVDLKEVDPGTVEVGPGFRSDLGLRAFTRLSYNNILGKNWIGTLGAGGNRRLTDYRFIEYNLDATFVEPRFFGTRFLYTIGATTKKQRFPPDFNAVTTQFLTSFEHRIFKIITAKLAYKYERIRQFDVYFQNTLLADDNRSMLIGSFVPSLTFDTRDNALTTSSGFLITGSLEYAHPNFSGQPLSDGGAPAYQKWNAAIRKYTPITKSIVWSNVVAGGFARSNVSGREIPLIKLFRLGGYSTIRGFPEEAINVDDRKVKGTLTFLNLRTQFDLPLVGELKFAPFLDAGNLYLDKLQGLPFFRAGAGFGLHYMTPVGPINLDWGHKLNPVSGESPNQIHFSVGMI